MRCKMIVLLSAVTGAASCGGTATAETLYDNLAATPSLAVNVNAGSFDAASFSTTATGTTLSKVTFPLRLFNAAANSGVTTFAIYDATGAAGSPGGKLADLGTIPNASMSATYANYTIGGLSVPLAPSSPYWLVRSATTIDEVRWLLTSTNIGVGNSSGFAYLGPQGGWITYPQFFVLAEIVAVPEIDPSGMGAVFALVTGAIGLLERRRKCHDR